MRQRRKADIFRRIEGKAALMRQSVLRMRPERKPVPQDPADEPAEKLLVRGKSEKGQLQQTEKVKKSK